MMTNSNRFIIIGAGATGLALAQGLKKENIPFTIYERNGSIDTRRNWTFGLHWGINALRELMPEDLFAGLETCQVDPRHPGLDSWYSVPFLNGQTGKVIKVLDSDIFYRLRRDKFRKWLATGIDVQWGKEVSDIEYSDDGNTVTAFFSDGSRDTGRLIIGSDGTHSRIRTLLVGEEKAKVTQVEDFATTMCYSKHTAEHALFLRSEPFHPLLQGAAHPNNLLAFLSVHDADSENPADWVFFHYISYHAPPEHADFSARELVKYQKELAKDFADPWKSLYEWMDDEGREGAWFTRLQNWDPELPEHAWDNHDGRVTLAGDAARPMTFQRGQGLNNSLQDSFEIFKAVKKFYGGEAGGKEAVDAYETEMKGRAGKEVKASAGTTIAMHDFERMGESALMKNGLRATK